MLFSIVKTNIFGQNHNSLYKITTEGSKQPNIRVSNTFHILILVPVEVQKTALGRKQGLSAGLIHPKGALVCVTSQSISTDWQLNKNFWDRKSKDSSPGLMTPKHPILSIIYVVCNRLKVQFK